MNYELAQKLKEAGFPQHPNSDYDYEGRWIFPPNTSLADPDVDEKAAYAPTLSKLIEACGLIQLFPYQRHGQTLEGQVWSAEGGKWEGNTLTLLHFGNGSTPEEAVARLWIALNKKP